MEKNPSTSTAQVPVSQSEPVKDSKNLEEKISTPVENSKSDSDSIKDKKEKILEDYNKNLKTLENLKTAIRTINRNILERNGARKTTRKEHREKAQFLELKSRLSKVVRVQKMILTLNNDPKG